MHGQTIQYGRRGDRLSETNYKDNRTHGSMIIYGKRDKVIYHAVYKNGTLDEVLIEKGGGATRKR